MKTPDADKMSLEPILLADELPDEGQEAFAEMFSNVQAASGRDRARIMREFLVKWGTAEQVSTHDKTFRRH